MNDNFLEQMAEVPPLTNLSMVAKIYCILEEKIISGVLSPDTKLVEDNIAKVLGVSRSPVRDALMRLENAGLVVRGGAKGRVVASFTEHEVIESYEIREMIESFSGGLACLEAKEADFCRVEEILQQMEDFTRNGEDAISLLNLNYDFHYLLISPCPNKQLLRMFENALKPIKWCWNLNASWRNSPSSSAYLRHRKLFEIYRKRDREAYEKLARSHIHDSAIEFRKEYVKRKGVQHSETLNE
jgi:DNA-binding GntR family transcriptional regulator